MARGNDIVQRETWANAWQAALGQQTEDAGPGRESAMVFSKPRRSRARRIQENVAKEVTRTEIGIVVSRK